MKQSDYKVRDTVIYIVKRVFISMKCDAYKSSLG